MSEERDLQSIVLHVLGNEPHVCASAALCSQGSVPREKMWALALFRSALWSPKEPSSSIHSPMSELASMISEFERAKGKIGEEDKIVHGHLSDYQALKDFFHQNPVKGAISKDLTTPLEVDIPASLESGFNGTGVSPRTSRTMLDLETMRREYQQAFSKGIPVGLVEMLNGHSSEKSFPLVDNC